MLKQIFSWMMILALCLGGASAVGAAEGGGLKVFLSLGKGTVVKNNIPAAKETAVKDGLYASVEQALFDTLSSDAVAANFGTVTEILGNTPETFIDGYKVIAERRLEGHYHVIVEASVSMARLTERLTASGIVVSGHEKPKVLFLIAEKRQDSPAFDYWWGPGMSFISTVSDDALSGAMANRGFEVLPHRAIIEDASDLRPDGSIDSKEAQRIGSAFGADVVVAGRAWTEASGNVMGEEHSLRASIVAEAVLVGSGQVIGRTHKEGIAVGSDAKEVGIRAITDATMEAGRELSSVIIEAMKEKKSRTTMIEVVVEGTNFFENFTQLSRTMEGVDGVISVRPRERRLERAVMVINFTGEGKALAGKLLAQNYKGFSITISEVSKDHMKVDMVAGGKNTVMQ